MFRAELEFLGVDIRRIHFSWVSAAEGRKWADLVNDVSKTIRELGPLKEFRAMGGANA
jgi:coenzyme F420-reducing hydrogenase delta subunit